MPTRFEQHGWGGTEMFSHHNAANAEAKVDVAYEMSVLEVGGVAYMRTANGSCSF